MGQSEGMKNKSNIFLVSGLAFAILFGILILTVFYNENGQDSQGEDNLINSSAEPETDPRIDMTKAACTGYSSNTIIKEYGNWSKAIYYDHDNWDSLSPRDLYFDQYWAQNGGPVTGAGFDSCLGGISLWWDPDIPVNETVMDEIYSRFCDRAKENGMEEPYLTFIPGKLIPD